MVLSQAYEHALQNSLPLEKEFPPPIPPTADEVLTNNLLTMAVSDPPWVKTGMLTTAGLYGLEELVASWLANDKGLNGSYFTPRVLQMAVYGALIHVLLRGAMEWFLRVCFSGHTGLTSQALQILITNLLIIPFLNILYLVFTAMAVDAHAYRQVRGDFLPMAKIICVFAPINLLCGYLFLSENARATASNTMSFLVGTYISTRIKKKRLAAPRRKYELKNDYSSDSNPSSTDPLPVHDLSDAKNS